MESMIIVTMPWSVDYHSLHYSCWPVGSSASMEYTPALWATLCLNAAEFDFLRVVVVTHRQGISVGQAAEQIDLTSSFFLPHHQMFIPFSVTASEICTWRHMCVGLGLGKKKKKSCPWLGQVEVDRLYWSICHRPQSGKGRGKKSRRHRPGDAFWWCLGHQTNKVEGKRVG